MDGVRGVNCIALLSYSRGELDKQEELDPSSDIDGDEEEGGTFKGNDPSLGVPKDDQKDN